MKRTIIFIFCISFFCSGQGIHALEEDLPVDIDDLFTDTDEEEAELPVDIDDLFTQDEKGTTQEEKNEEEETVDVKALTTSPTKVTGKVTAGVGAGVGLEEWPNTPDADDRDISSLIRYSGFYDTVATMMVDARPAPYVRFYTSVQTALNSTSMSFSDPYMKEVFIDYTFADTVFVRVGKQALTWGQGTLLNNPANLASRVSQGVAVRTSFPLGPVAVDGVVYIKSQWVDNPYSNINPKSFAYAAQAEGTIGPLVMSLSGHYKELDTVHEDFGGAASMSFALGSVDLALDGVGYWSSETPAWAPVTWGALGRLFWETESRSMSVLGEYQFDSTVEEFLGHYTALALKTPKIFGKAWQPVLQWRHAWQDDSGELIFGLDGTVSPKLKLSIGIPIVYGEPGTYYREALTEGVENVSDIDDDKYLIPVDNVASLLLTLRLNLSF